MEIITLDGNEFIGNIIFENDEIVIIKSLSGTEYTIPRNQITSISPVKDIHVEDGRVFRTDPNYTRYLFAPSGFSMPKRSQYCSDKCIFFPSMGYAFTDRISVQGGIGAFPGMSQVPYFIFIKATLFEEDKAAFALGFEHFSVTGEDFGAGAGLLFGVYTLGNHDRHFSMGIAYGYEKNRDDDYSLSETPAIILAGIFRAGDHQAFITENYYINEDTQIISAGTRFWGRKISVDFAFVTTPEALSGGSGFPLIPWLDFTFQLDN